MWMNLALRPEHITCRILARKKKMTDQMMSMKKYDRDSARGLSALLGIKGIQDDSKQKK